MTAKKIVKVDEKSVDKRFGKLYHIKAVLKDGNAN